MYRECRFFRHLKPLLFALILHSVGVQASGGDECEGCLPFSPVMWPALDTRVIMAMVLFKPANESRMTEPYTYEGADNILSFEDTDNTAAAPADGADAEGAEEPAERFLRHIREIRQDEAIAPSTDDALRPLMGMIGTYAYAEKLRKLDPFIIGLKSAPSLSAQEKITVLCMALDTVCGEITAPAADFVAYLDARVSFYSGDYVPARQRFEALTESAQPWVKETSQYNLIRVSLRQALPLTEYGEADFSRRDRAEAARALQAIDRYLLLYPNGLYATSAAGLRRRAYWLMDDFSAMTTAYQPDIERAQRGEINPHHFLNELDRYAVFPPSLYSYPVQQEDSPRTGMESNPADHVAWQVPVVAGSQVLMRLRQDNEKAVPLGDLLAHEQDFSDQEYKALFRLLVLSTQFYEHKNYQAVIENTGDWESLGKQSSYVAYSLLALRAYALEATAQWELSAVLWAFIRAMPAASPLMREYAEKAQVVNHEIAGNVAGIFAKESPVNNAQYRVAVITRAANTAALEQLVAMPELPAAEKQLALNTLLRKTFAARDAKVFAQYYRQYSPQLENRSAWCPLKHGGDSLDPLDYGCASPEAAIDSMASASPTPDARLCFADWLSDGCGSDVQHAQGLDHEEPSTQAGRVPVPGDFAHDGFEQSVYDGMNIYQLVLDDPKSTSEQRAYALYRSLQCFYHAEEATLHGVCAGLGQMEKYPVEQRKRWFRELKTRYAQTPWAAAQRVYW